MSRPRKFDETEVLQHAMAAFWKHGFEAVTFRMLSSATGVGLRSLSNAFVDKETLYLRTLDIYVSQIEQRLPTLIGDGGTKALVGLFANATGPHPDDSPRHFGCFLVNQLAVVQRHDDRLKTLIDRYFACLGREFQRALDTDGIARSAARARMLVTVLVGVQMTVRLHGNTLAAAGTAEMVSDLVSGWRS